MKRTPPVSAKPLTRREALAALYGPALAAGLVPALGPVQSVLAGQSSTASGCRPAVSLTPTGEPWMNWPQSEPAGPNVKYTPTSISHLVSIARNASAQARVRASGSRWSSSGAARADAAWVDTSALNRVFNSDLTRLADERSPDIEAGNLVLVQAGTKIHALATALWQRGLSVPTLGGELGQSIAGAISTGTHGSDIELPPIAEMVRAIHLVSPGGCEYWLEHPDRPIASRSALQRNYADWHESMTVLREADPFNAALVGAGRCGLIYAYVLEVEPAYQLRADRGRSSWPDVKAHLERASNSGDWLSYIRSNNLPFNESTTVQSRLTPSPISVNGRLSLIWTGTRNPGQFRWIHADRENGGWTRKQIVDDGKLRHSPHRPAIAFFNGRYYVAWTGTDQGHPYIHLIRSTDATGAYWTDHIRFDGSSATRPEAESSEGPVLLAANSRLHIVWVGSNKPGQFRWITSTNGSTWGEKQILTDGETRESNHRPSIAFFQNRYYLAWTGTNPDHPHVHMIRSTDSSGRTWGGHIRFDGVLPTQPEAKSSDGPCLLAANNRLHIVWVGTNRPGEFRWIVSNEGVVWGSRRVLADRGETRQSNYAPEIAYHDGRYYLFWAGYGSDQNVHVLRSTSSTGTSWTNHARLSVPPGPRVDMQEIRALDVAINPETANGQAWWTVRTKVPLSATQTVLKPGRKAGELKLLFNALAIALRPETGGDVGAIVGWLLGLALGGPVGGSLFAIAGRIAGREIADSEDVFAAITDLVFAMELNSPPTTGKSFEITSGNAVGYSGGYEQKFREFWNDFPKVQYTEVFFDAQRSDYLQFIEAILGYFRSSGSGKQAGYVSIRFMAPSEAPLAMQRWPITAAVEVVIVEALDPAAKRTIEAVNRFAQGYDARFHWGMIRPADYRPVGVRNEIERWKAGAARLGVQAGDGFSSAFSRAAGLEP